MKKDNNHSLKTALLHASECLRTKMDANEYKDYLLGMIFYKYLSDRFLYTLAEENNKKNLSLTQIQSLYQKNILKCSIALKQKLSYTLRPQDTFSYMIEKVNHNSFKLDDLTNSIANIRLPNFSSERILSLFNFTSPKLGQTKTLKTKTIADIIRSLANVELVKTSTDSLGDAYEFLIGNFAQSSGKRGGEFYTPQKISELLTELILINQKNKQQLNVYDPTMGSGSLLLKFKKFAPQIKIDYFGQEINQATFVLAKMNMILHGVDIDKQHLINCDSLSENLLNSTMDGVIMNPPYSLHWSSKKSYLADARFKDYHVLAPKSKADYAFLLDGFYHLNNSGTMAIILPTGVLFRQSAESKIRQKLLELNAIETIIKLPEKLFYSTTIPTVVIVLKKQRKQRDVLFIDAGSLFEKGQKQNELSDDNVTQILDIYQQRKDIRHLSHLASFEEMQANNFNLNFPRYIDQFPEEEKIDLNELALKIKTVNKNITKTQSELSQSLKHFSSSDKKTMAGMKNIINALNDVRNKNE